MNGGIRSINGTARQPEGDGRRDELIGLLGAGQRVGVDGERVRVDGQRLVLV
jgi:hypothetical protein